MFASDFSENGINPTTGVFSREANLFNKYPCCIMWGDLNKRPIQQKFTIQQLMRSTLLKIRSGVV